MNLRRIGLGLFALIAFGTAAAGVAQTPPAPPAPPLPNTNRTAAPTLTAPPTSSSTPAPDAVTSAIPSANVPTVTAPTATPAPSGPRRGRKPSASSPAPGPSTTATPQPPQFSALDGVWEIELQPLNTTRALYSHMSIVQGAVTGNTTVLSGYWQRNNAKLPMTGTFDGRLITMTVADPVAPITFSGYVEAFSDMVGLQKIGTKTTSFTAQHRKKVKL